MRIVQIVSAVSEEATGPTYVVKRLCESLMEGGQNVTLAALDWAPVPIQLPYLKTFPIGCGPRKLGRSKTMYRWLNDKAHLKELDIIHSHGLWMMPNVYPCHIARKHNIPLIVAPHDTLSKWSMQTGSKMKQIFWPLVQKPALASVTCFHATAESEYQDIRRHGFMQPVAIVANGVDIPSLKPKTRKEGKTLLFLSRVHPQKGLDMLLRAWGAIQDNHTDWSLRIVGSDDGWGLSSGYFAQMRELANQLALRRVEFSGTLYADAKWQAYFDADLFVLPSRSENFGVVVAEALAAGVPAVVSKGAPWAGLVDGQAGWWIDIGVEPLIAALRVAMSRSGSELEAMGKQGRVWMERDFSWLQIGQQMTATYRWLCDRSSPKPDWVILD